MEVTDEMGVLIKTETPLISYKETWDDPRMWANTCRMVQQLFQRDKNSPSLVMWSMENELLRETDAPAAGEADHSAEEG